MSILEGCARGWGGSCGGTSGRACGMTLGHGLTDGGPMLNHDHIMLIHTQALLKILLSRAPTHSLPSYLLDDKRYLQLAEASRPDHQS